MSYAGPEFEPTPQPSRSRGRTALVAVATLVPTALVAWLIWTVVGSASDGGGPARSLPETQGSTTSAAADPTPTRSATQSESATDGSKDDTKPGGSKPGSGKPSASAPAANGPLKGKVVVIDPGHNPGNFQHTTEINRQVDIGTNRKECDTTGTSTNGGYTEAEFTLDVSRKLRTLLEQQGATVTLVQNGDRPWGPCVDERARIGNTAKADAVVSVHADGSAAGNRGFHVILPALVKGGDADTSPIVAPSRALGERIAGNFVRATGSAPSNYVGDGTGLDVRSDLGGLNLSKVPKVFIECGNMRDAKDAALLTDGAWRQRAAQGISEGIVSFLRG
ncbi:N-acetylmuramoyl-L-alanine amidase [Streptomyces sp. NPDC091292]|uniref:N-acetylmuramoyl-L-alanine amidase n=1 Tax=Streptomyces sp. NPDC091292 TaxID=3365991 RepID=UPI00380E71C3